MARNLSAFFRTRNGVIAAIAIAAVVIRTALITGLMAIGIIPEAVVSIAAGIAVVVTVIVTIAVCRLVLITVRVRAGIVLAVALLILVIGLGVRYAGTEHDGGRSEQHAHFIQHYLILERCPHEIPKGKAPE